MRGPRVIPIVIAAGGTGGHFFPAEALAETLAARGHRVVLMTDARSAGRASPVFDAADRHVLPGAGIAGRGAWRGAKAGLALAAGTYAAARLLRSLRPGAIVGFGGYPSIRPIMAARFGRLKTPIILHEQNAVLGRANRALSARASRLALSFADTKRVPPGTRTVVTGNPVRPPIAALAGAGYEAPQPGGPIRLLVTGGSLGARVLSEVVPQALIALPQVLRERLEVVQQARKEDAAAVREAYVAAGISADVAPFFTDMAGHLSAAHLVIARAGASTVSELAVAGRPAILVPLPHAIDDHQRANAMALESAGAAWMIAQPDFTVATLAGRLAQLLADGATLTAAAEAAHREGRPQAASALADLVETALLPETLR